MSPSGHKIDTGWENTWRSAAVHWGEGTGNWRVEGTHYINYNDQDLVFAYEWVSDCSIYDGWWD